MPNRWVCLAVTIAAVIGVAGGIMSAADPVTGVVMAEQWDLVGKALGGALGLAMLVGIAARFMFPKSFR